jgi:hypothetical protein
VATTTEVTLKLGTRLAGGGDEALKRIGQEARRADGPVRSLFQSMDDSLKKVVGSLERMEKLLQRVQAGARAAGDELEKMARKSQGGPGMAGRLGGLAAGLGGSFGLASAALAVGGHIVRNAGEAGGDVNLALGVGLRAGPESDRALEQANGLFGQFVKNNLAGMDSLFTASQRFEESERNRRTRIRSGQFLENEFRREQVLGLESGVNQRRIGFETTLAGIHGGLAGDVVRSNYRSFLGLERPDIRRLGGAATAAGAALGRPEDAERALAAQHQLEQIGRANAVATADAQAKKVATEEEYGRALKEQQSVVAKIAELERDGAKSYADRKALDDQLAEAGQRLLAAEQQKLQVLREQGQTVQQNATRYRDFAQSQVDLYRQIASQERLRQDSLKVGFGLTDRATQRSLVETAKKLKARGVESLSGPELDLVRGNPLFQEELERQGRRLAETNGALAPRWQDRFANALAGGRGGGGNPFEEITKILGLDQRQREAERQEKIALELKSKIEAEIKLSGESVADELQKTLVPQITALIQQQLKEAAAAMERELGRQPRIKADAQRAGANGGG